MPRIPFLDIVRGERRTGTHDTAALSGDVEEKPRRRIIIVGSPNVGKSVLFNRLTGRYVFVSNYPGTTVEVSRGKAKLGDTLFEVVDTPGMYSLRPLCSGLSSGGAFACSNVCFRLFAAKNRLAYCAGTD